MARIPDEELKRLKTEVDLAALVRSKGIELKPHGSKDLVGLSPFTEEKTPSFIVTPGKNLWHCMSSGTGGSVIDFLMKHDGVSFRHAVELLREQNPELYGGKARTKATVPKLEAPVSFDADDQTLFKEVLDYYHERLKQNPAALDYLKSRGITAEAIDHFKIGFADRTLGLRLPMKNRKEGQTIRTRLQKIGLYRQSGHEHFNGCVVFPIEDADHQVREVYGRKIGPQQNKIYHLYLPGPHGGIFNPLAVRQREVILTESVIDALTFWCHGFKNVTCIYGTEGFTGELEKALSGGPAERVYLAYDRDEAGDRAAARDSERLQSAGLECFRVKFPHGMDPNAYALKVTPAEKSLKILINAAEWIGKGADEARQRGDGAPASSRCARSEAEGEEHREPSGRGDEQWLGKGKMSPCIENPDTVSSTKELAAEVSGSEEEAAKEKKPDAATPSAVAPERRREEEKMPGVSVREAGDDTVIDIADRSYRVRGLGRNTSFEVLKVNLRVWFEEKFYLDTVDLYRSKDRAHFIAMAAEETGLKGELLKRDLGKVLLKLEGLQEERIREEMEPRSKRIEVAAEEKQAALELLKSPDLLERILEDFEKCGIVGERVNKLTGYLAAVSRKLDKPLAVIIQSTSAAGKTSLMEAVLEMIPEEERVKYSAMTGQSLYYLGETNLKNKILAIVEEEGAEKASYALKLLQSEGELTIASTGKDENGRMKTEEYHVEGPVMIFLTTTAVDIDEELLNRCLVLSVDESREQTEAIHRLQREAETFEGLMRKVERDRILKVHRNAQRLLRPLNVVNPFAPKLTFLSDRTRTRRDHVKYLALIRSIALLHQYQRKIHDQGGLRYIEVTLEDIEAANQVAHEVLGRSLDELPPQTRRLLTILKSRVEEQCRKQSLDPDQCLFTRRQVREWSGWTEFQVRTHLTKLEAMEYVLPHHGGRGQRFVYELLFDGDLESEKPQLNGLIEAGSLKDTMPTSSMNAAATSPQRAPLEAGSRSFSLAAEAAPGAESHSNGTHPPEIAQGAEKKLAAVS